MNTVDSSKLPQTAIAPKNYRGSIWKSAILPESDHRYVLTQVELGLWCAVSLATGNRWHTPKSTPEEATEDLEFVAEDVTITLTPAAKKVRRWFLPCWSQLSTGWESDMACFYEFDGDVGTYFFRNRKGGISSEPSNYSLAEAVSLTQEGGWKEVMERPNITASNPTEPKTRWFVPFDYKPGDCFWEFVGGVGTFFAANGGYAAPAGPSLKHLEDSELHREVFERPTFTPKAEPKTRWFVPIGFPTGCFWEFVGTEGTFFYSSGDSTPAGVPLKELESNAIKYREVFERPTASTKTKGPAVKTRWFVRSPDQEYDARWVNVAFLEFVGDAGTWHHKNGSTEASSFTVGEFVAVSGGRWTEVFERPKIESPKPEKSRFFQHVDGFSDETLYVEVRPDGTSDAVTPNEAPEYDTWFPLDTCLKCVAEGVWREIQVRRFRDIGPEACHAGPWHNPVDFIEFIGDRPGISVHRDGTRSSELKGGWGTLDAFRAKWIDDPKYHTPTPHFEEVV